MVTAVFADILSTKEIISVNYNIAQKLIVTELSSFFEWFDRNSVFVSSENFSKIQDGSLSYLYVHLKKNFFRYHQTIHLVFCILGISVIN